MTKASRQGTRGRNEQVAQVGAERKWRELTCVSTKWAVVEGKEGNGVQYNQPSWLTNITAEKDCVLCFRWSRDRRRPASVRVCSQQVRALRGGCGLNGPTHWQGKLVKGIICCRQIKVILILIMLRNMPVSQYTCKGYKCLVVILWRNRSLYSYWGESAAISLVQIGLVISDQIIECVGFDRLGEATLSLVRLNLSLIRIDKVGVGCTGMTIYIITQE